MRLVSVHPGVTVEQVVEQTGFALHIGEVVQSRLPTEEELRHDFLWRVHAATPGKGRIGVFNRSHYEAVLVERVNNLVPETVWSRRYQQINNFESLLASSGTKTGANIAHLAMAPVIRRSRLARG